MPVSAATNLATGQAPSDVSPSSSPVSVRVGSVDAGSLDVDKMSVTSREAVADGLDPCGKIARRGSSFFQRSGANRRQVSRKAGAIDPLPDLQAGSQGAVAGKKLTIGALVKKAANAQPQGEGSVSALEASIYEFELAVDVWRLALDSEAKPATPAEVDVFVYRALRGPCAGLVRKAKAARAKFAAAKRPQPAAAKPDKKAKKPKKK